MRQQFIQLCDILEKVSDRGYACGVAFVQGTPYFSSFTYAPEFLRRYEAEDLSKEDHTLRAGFAQDGVFFWSDLEQLYGSSRAMEFGKDFGMEDGICWSTTVNGLKSIGSISLTKPAHTADIDIEQIKLAFDLATLEASREISSTKLGVNELEFLSLAALGRSTEEIAGELGISVPAVRKRKAKMQANLGASNLAHAVAIASSRGLLSNYRFV
jgi:DNA-binding CsgD family transcriptional regulator